jgi:hypothetical protein
MTQEGKTGTVRTQTFDLEGVTYYAEGRKCGKAVCRCQTGDLHGPYWYRRDQSTGKVAYLGKTLPPELDEARRRLTLFADEVEKTRRRLLAQAEALRRLQTRQHLTAQDRAAIQDLGFGMCLVSEPLSAGTQEDPAQKDA